MLALLLLALPQQPKTPSITCVPGSDVTGRFFGVHTLCVSSTRKPEKYDITGPPDAADPNTPNLYPLIVLFHGYGGDHTEFQDPSLDDFKNAAVAAGFVVMMHDGGFNHVGTHATYGNESFLKHTQAAVADAIAQFPIARERLYGYGFSMGGGEVLTYAARHMDPNGPEGMFAAVVNHTGSVSVPMTYFCPGQSTTCVTCTDAIGQQCAMNTLYYGDWTKDYCTFPWRFQRATVLDIECYATPCINQTGSPSPCGATAHDDTSQARNLFVYPIDTYYHPSDPRMSLKTQNLELATFMSSWWNGNYNTITGYTVIGPDPHSWKALDPVPILTFFASNPLGRTLDPTMNPWAVKGYVLVAENDRRYLHFAAQRAQNDDFGRFLWWYAGNNFMQLLSVAGGIYNDAPNLVSLTVFLNAPSLVVPPTSHASGELRILDGNDVPIHLEPYPGAPSQVFFDDGTGEAPSGDYLFSGSTLILNRSGMSGVGTWRIL